MKTIGFRTFAVALLAVSFDAAFAQTPGESPAESPAETPTQTPAETPAQTPADAPARASTSAVRAGTPFAVDVDYAVGAQLADVSGSREKFERYVDPEGLVLDLRARYLRPDTAHFLELGIESPNQRDESYHLEIGRRGRYRVSAAYDAIPHRFSGGVFLWSGFGKSWLQIANPVKDALQAVYPLNTEYGPQPGAATPPFPDPNPDPPVAGDVAQRAIVEELYRAADPVSFGLQRRTGSASLEVNLGRDAVAWARVRNENRTGTRVLGTGTYERWFDFGGTSAQHSFDRFIVLGAELAEPIDHRTLSVSAGTGIHRERWLADVEYTLTRFRNFDDVLLFENPFRTVDAEATGPLTATGGGGGVNRGRFVTGNVSLEEDSLSHDVTLSGAVDIPLHGRLGASLSYGMITQDQAFQPYTRNTAIDTAVDALPTTTTPAATLPLPQRDLNGDVRTIAGNLTATVRPVHPLTLSAKYRAYRYDGRSDELFFPGYAAFGDSFWRLKRNDPSPATGFTNEVFDYWRHEADLDADYRLSRLVSLSVGAGWEAWRFDHLRLDKLDEYSVGAGVSVRPARNASISARYRFADRSNDGYLQGATAANPEARGLVNYNWAERTRHLADVRAQYAPTGVVSVGLLGRVVDDDYGGDTEGGTAADQFRFGRTSLRRWLGSADVNLTPGERFSFNANYSVELRREKMASAAKDNPAKGADDFGFDESFAPENYWNSDIDETVNSVGLGTTFEIVPGRISFAAGYTLSFSDIDVETRNPNPIVTDPASPTLANAIAQDWPTIKNRLHEVTADLGYRFSPNVRAGVRYLFASYDLDDFAWDGQQPYMAGISLENSTRYLFADATYNAYQAHVGTVYVAGSF